MATRSLRFSSGPAAGQAIEIDREVVVGREGEDLAVADGELSRRHAAFRPVENGVEVEDLGSLNGTFVDGRRISGKQVVTLTATIKLGTSEGSVELAMPEVTRAAPIASPDLTRKHEVASPEVTAPRPIPAPDVTVQREVASPDVTAKRPIPAPDVTVQRPVAQQGPPGGPPPPPQRQRSAEAGEGGRAGPPVPLIAAGVLAVIVAVVLVVLLTSGGGEEAVKRKLDVVHEVSAPTAADKRRSEMRPGAKAVKWTLTGQASGKPFGKGSDESFVTLEPIRKPPPGSGPPPKGPRPASVSARFEIRFPRGTITAIEAVKSTRVRDSLQFTGTGRVLKGTGDFEGAKGTFKISGSRPKFDESFERVRWRGSVEY